MERRGHSRLFSKDLCGKKLNGYTLHSVIGAGQFGTVYKATYIANQNHYAVKVIPKAKVTDPDDQRRLQREIDVMKRLCHVNIVRLHDAFEDELHHYLVMEHCAGGELKNYIVKNDKLKEETAALLFKQIVSAVSYCHNVGIVHRDLKPQNIMMGKFPNVKLMDFGFSAYIEKEPMTEYCGSPCFCSPEVLLRMEYDGVKNDIWSLGVVLYTMVTGNLPWDCTDHAVMVGQICTAKYYEPKVSLQCKDLIAGMLRLNPSERMPLPEVLAHPWLRMAAQKSSALKGRLGMSSSYARFKPLDEPATRKRDQSTDSILAPAPAGRVRVNKSLLALRPNSTFSADFVS